MFIKTTYVAADGKEFDDERDCKRYENTLDALEVRKELNKALNVFTNYCDGRKCNDCIFQMGEHCRVREYAPCTWQN